MLYVLLFIARLFFFHETFIITFIRLLEFIGIWVILARILYFIPFTKLLSNKIDNLIMKGFTFPFA